MEANPHNLLTKAEAKARLGLSCDTALYRLIRRGKLRVIKYGKTSPLRFRQMDVDACLEACAVTGADASPGGRAEPGESPKRASGAGKEPTP